MDARIIRLEDKFWHIRTDNGELSCSERDEVEEYLGEAKIPYQIIEGCICIPAEVKRNTVFEVLEHFYDGRAEVYPF